MADLIVSAAVDSVLDDLTIAAMRTTMGLGTADAPQFGTIELGAASDTTLSRVSAGVAAIEGATIATLSAANAFTAQNSNTLRFRQAITTLATGAQSPVANTDYTVAAMTSTLALTLPSGTAGDAIWIDLIGCNGTAAVTFASGIQRVGQATGTLSTITPPAGTQWLYLKYAGGAWKFSDSFSAITFAVDSVGTDSYAITDPNYTAYNTGDAVTFIAATANTGTCSLNRNSLGAKTLVKVNSGAITTALETGDILANQVVTAVYDGTNYQVTSRLASVQELASEVTLTDGATVTQTMVTGKVRQHSKVTLGGNRTLAFSGLAAGMEGNLRVIQDGTGSRTLTLPANSRMNGSATTVTLLTAASAENILSWYSPDGTNIRWTNGTY